MPSALARTLLNAMLFNAGWAACILMRDGLSLIMAAGLLCFHLLFLSNYSREWFFVVLVTAIGLCFDTVAKMSGLLQPVEGALPAVFWMGALWPLFATTINHSLSTFRTRLLPAALLGAVFGPLAYFSAIRLGAAETAFPLWGFVVSLALFWAALMPLLMFLGTLICPNDIRGEVEKT